MQPENGRGGPVEADSDRKKGSRPLFRRILRFAFNTVRNVCTLMVLVYLGVTAFYDRTRMVSESMEPTFRGKAEGGDWVLIRRAAYRSHPPRRGDLVSFLSEDGVLIIKRVAALPGEKVQIKDERLWVNGAPVVDPPVFKDLKYSNCGNLLSPTRAIEVRKDWYFVLGDNSPDSYDSRFFGAIPKDQIRGRAECIFWPLRRIGRV